MPRCEPAEKRKHPVIVAVGVDLIELDRIQRLWDDGSDRFLARVFTLRERAYCLARARPAESLAARYAAKEAVMKCLGTGWSEGVGFTQIEVERDATGRPRVHLSGRAAEIAARLGITGFHVSLSHSGQAALAFAVAVRDP
jgi:holo-[acyl-carrier protein] synthase